MKAFLLIFSILGWIGLSLYVLQRGSLEEQAKILLDSQSLDDLHLVLSQWQKLDPQSPILHQMQGRFAIEKYLLTGESLWIDAGEKSLKNSLELFEQAQSYYWLANLYKIAARVEGKKEYYFQAMEHFKQACLKDPYLPYYYSLFFEMLIEFQKDSRYQPQGEDQKYFLENVSFALGNYMALKDYYTKQYLAELFTYFPPSDIARIFIPVEGSAEVRKLLRESYLNFRMNESQ